MIRVGIDEITFVLSIPETEVYAMSFKNWEANAINIMEWFEYRSHLPALFGPRTQITEAPPGYTRAYAYGQHEFYLAVAYHEEHPKMGVIVKFSATALDRYLKKSGQEVYQFLQNVQDRHYNLRVSRADIAIDYLNEAFMVDEIYHDLIEERVGVFSSYISKTTKTEMFKKRKGQIKTIGSNDVVETLYIGSVKSDCRLRIYDKKVEQIARHGVHYSEAIKADGWVRFEAVLRDEYAHQIGGALMKVTDDTAYRALLAKAFLQKFRLRKLEDGNDAGDTYYTDLLASLPKDALFRLQAPVSRNYDLYRKIEHMLNTSGTSTSLFAIYKIWGEDGLNTMLNALHDIVCRDNGSDETNKWLAKNTNDYRQDFPIFADLLSEIIKIDGTDATD